MSDDAPVKPGPVKPLSVGAQPARPANDDDAAPAASRAEQMVRQASDQDIAPHEKQAIGAQTSREEDA